MAPFTISGSVSHPSAARSRRRHRRRVVPVVAALTVGLLCTLPLTAHAAVPRAASTDRKVLDEGHVDIGPRIVDGRWILQARDDSVSPSVWRDLDDLALAADSTAEVDVPSDDSYSFLGEAGDTVWILPQVQQDGIVWPGWNTQDESVVDAVQGDITWTVVDVDGPGDLWLFTSGSFGAPSLIFDSDDGWPQSTTIGLDVHVHGNWAFSAKGLYRITMRMSATSASGGSLSDEQVLIVAIGSAARSKIPAAGTSDSSATDDSDSATSDDGDSAGQGNGTESLEDEGDSLPYTGAGDTLPLTVLALVAVVGGIVLRRAAHRRPTHDDDRG